MAEVGAAGRVIRDGASPNRGPQSMQANDYFSQDCATARGRFLAAATARGWSVESVRILTPTGAVAGRCD